MREKNYFSWLNKLFRENAPQACIDDKLQNAFKQQEAKPMFKFDRKKPIMAQVREALRRSKLQRLGGARSVDIRLREDGTGTVYYPHQSGGISVSFGYDGMAGHKLPAALVDALDQAFSRAVVENLDQSPVTEPEINL